VGPEKVDAVQLADDCPKIAPECTRKFGTSPDRGLLSIRTPWPDVITERVLVLLCLAR